MEEKINIAEILKDKKNGLILYSPIFGECAFCYVRKDTNDICVKKHNGVKEFFDSKGLYYNTGEVMLFPSKSMRDWSKFAWKKGDVLVSNDGGTEVIFDKWYDDTYTSFYGKHCLDSENENNIKYFEEFVCTTERYFIESKDAAQTYINTIEERLGGKLNLETLEIEKQQLFDAIAKENKAWDAEKKQIVDLKPKCEFKPFDKVLVRDSKSDNWRANLFGYIDKDGFYSCVWANWAYCIHYIGNESLLGTTKDVEV